MRTPKEIAAMCAMMIEHLEAASGQCLLSGAKRARQSHSPATRPSRVKTPKHVPNGPTLSLSKAVSANPQHPLGAGSRPSHPYGGGCPLQHPDPRLLIEEPGGGPVSIFFRAFDRCEARKDDPALEGRAADVRYQGQSGRNADITEVKRLNPSGHSQRGCVCRGCI